MRSDSLPRKIELTQDASAFRETFLTQLRSVNIGSREFPEVIERMLASKEGVNVAMSLEGEDALTLVNVLDQVGKRMGTITTIINALSRLLRLRVRPSIFRGGLFASSGEFVAHGLSSQVLAYS